MDISHVRYFLSVADELNFTRAAKTHYISRQALRQAICALEMELGASLVQSERNHVSLTPAGRLFEAIMRPAVECFNDAEQRAKECVRERSSLAIGYSETFSPFLLPEIGEHLESLADELSLGVKVLPLETTETASAVREGTVDAALLMACDPERVEGLVAVPLVRFSLGVSVRKDSPLAFKERIPLADLDGKSLVGFDRMEETLQPLQEELAARGCSCEYSITGNVIDALHRTSECGEMFLGAWAPRFKPIGMNVVTLPLEGFPFDLCLVARPDFARTPLFGLIRDHLKSRIDGDPRVPHPEGSSSGRHEPRAE
ncbi:LysR family transcriptional regulator [Arabiibacter massiliensis]|uniref:LysR family transcriptional regulator n=1 Tax=Arabiibacter massiliensis TaxID=1870985 RepID=UPI00155B26CE|nr:LysR family transcriptional regulator [Arabiibacter massiliensis]